ncbi:response regulator receiver modulated GAF sensor protein [Haladaptatus paucihalophilus DX253]|uniref:PAS domain S-box-containing protein n=1 Tax=Haladaptatus paucihalophilus DX253 TaxID=797209 RepID=E7QXF1_HALPU|nr:PAS domain S-box protein [Haladaptatus paucihalophilus]EFW90954.1 response regulator receiver modulated GAF sensor protein [Haladaptatus paucihalophilus DX253]SHK27288.1 PAS domain S-box-containing protein [Haladaptatus paucihalophilus DX253]
MTEPLSNENLSTRSSLAETETEAETAFFKHIVRDALDAVVTISENGTIVFANEVAGRLFGYDQDELLDESIRSLFPERHQETYLDEFRRQVENADSTVEHSGLERTAIRRDGEEFPVSFSLREHRYHDRRLFTATIRDISERKRRQRELETVTEKYRTLVDTAPDAIFLADAETGTILEANRAASELLDRPIEEIEGMHQSELHPEDDRDRYERLFDRPRESDASVPDSHGLSVVDSNGNRIPVSINSNSTELNGRRVVQGIFHDISDRKRREEALNRLHATTHEMLETSCPETICQRAVETAADVLDLPATGIYLLSEDDDVLEPVVMTERVENLFDGDVPTYTSDDDLAWDVFETNEPRAISDFDATPSVADRDTPVRSGIIVPLGEHGIFITASTTPRDFDRIDFDLMRVLATNTETALTRAERERDIARQRDELTTLNRINAIVRDINQALVAAPSREEIERTVCERFADSSVYHGALIATLSSTEERLVVQTAAGIDDDYLDLITELGPKSKRGGAGTALQTGQFNVVEDVSSLSSLPQSFTSAANERGYGSIACIPISYRGTTYGVLVVYATKLTSVSERERSVFSELGETIGHAINAVESKKLLYSDSVLELEFSITNTGSFFVVTSEELGCSFELDGVVPRRDDVYLFYVTLSGAPSEKVIERADESPMVEHVRVIQETGDETLLEVALCGTETSAQALIERGAYVQRGSIEDGKGSIVVEVPANTRVRPFLDAVEEVYEETSLLSKQSRDRPFHSTSEFYHELGETLTERQAEILQAAYLAGYFDYPRASSGAELADTLDISSPTFHQHLQTAERKLLSLLFSERPRID